MQKRDDRREYERIEVGIEGQFFVRSEDGFICEFAGIIDNVSEGGLCVQIDKLTYKKVGDFLEVGQTLGFHSYDDNGFSVNEQSGVFQGEAKIVRKSMTEDAIDLGCQIDAKSENFKQYVENKKVYLYVKSISETKN